ncbi:hypothetical protein [Bosea beijingensis]|uniref:hypothetical protein n=1 Tax=Bosea beijingensis TaxID=3068632 RepID=UPI00274150DA|nr:hypothetical protein [Bosea sp. REN20]
MSLSKRAAEILAGLPKPQTGPVFKEANSKKPLSNAALLALLKRMERTDLTANGFRSTFRDWIAEKTHYPERDGGDGPSAHGE